MGPLVGVVVQYLSPLPTLFVDEGRVMVMVIHSLLLRSSRLDFGEGGEVVMAIDLLPWLESEGIVVMVIYQLRYVEGARVVVVAIHSLHTPSPSFRQKGSE